MLGAVSQQGRQQAEDEEGGAGLLDSAFPEIQSEAVPAWIGRWGVECGLAAILADRAALRTACVDQPHSYTWAIGAVAGQSRPSRRW